jgi:integrase
MNTDLKVSFYLKREHRGEDNQVYPIVGKIIIGNSIAQFSSKLKIDEKLWNVKAGRATGKSRVATGLNREINQINLSIHSHYREILKRTGTVSALEVKNAFQGIASAQKTLLVFFEEIMVEFQSHIGIDRTPKTYHGYKRTYNHLQRFIREKYRVSDIPINQLDLPFIEAFDFYLHVERKMKQSSVLQNIVLLQSAAKTAMHRNLIACPPFYGYRPEKPELQIRSLSADDFQRLVSTPVNKTGQRHIRDLFVFASFTGISYADLKSLTWKEIVTEEDGSLWISKTRRKTGILFNVKLLDIPLQIMEKYRGLAKGNLVFRVPVLEHINRTLKEIAPLCKIDKTMTFHVARHTFASQICLSQGVPIESVSRMLGHRSITTTQRYARVNRDKIGNDMKQLSLRISGKFSLDNNCQSIK